MKTFHFLFIAVLGQFTNKKDGSQFLVSARSRCGDGCSKDKANVSQIFQDKNYNHVYAKYVKNQDLKNRHFKCHDCCETHECGRYRNTRTSYCDCRCIIENARCLCEAKFCNF